jgi:hypothetical protein
MYPFICATELLTPLKTFCFRNYKPQKFTVLPLVGVKTLAGGHAFVEELEKLSPPTRGTMTTRLRSG